jgi:hypothetical protein
VASLSAGPVYLAQSAAPNDATCLVTPLMCGKGPRLPHRSHTSDGARSTTCVSTGRRNPRNGTCALRGHARLGRNGFAFFLRISAHEGRRNAPHRRDNDYVEKGGSLLGSRRKPQNFDRIGT